MLQAPRLLKRRTTSLMRLQCQASRVVCVPASTCTNAARVSSLPASVDAHASSTIPSSRQPSGLAQALSVQCWLRQTPSPSASMGKSSELPSSHVAVAWISTLLFLAQLHNESKSIRTGPRHRKGSARMSTSANRPNQTTSIDTSFRPASSTSMTSMLMTLPPAIRSTARSSSPACPVPPWCAANLKSVARALPLPIGIIAIGIRAPSNRANIPFTTS
mmetsp:Transcript_56744/g.157987  ORF Transcript_56744/g.157987 Transcript_56744/m.157987 type:complete len:218 (+) Transcript_56744:142-795(+)